MRYLRGIADLVSYYQGKDLKFGGYLEADWRGDSDESRLTSGYALP